MAVEARSAAARNVAGLLLAPASARSAGNKHLAWASVTGGMAIAAIFTIIVKRLVPPGPAFVIIAVFMVVAFAVAIVATKRHRRRDPLGQTRDH